MPDTNDQPATMKSKMLNNWVAKASAITAILGMVAAVIVFDDRYAKEEGLTEQLAAMQTSIIAEMRTEVTKNRSAMISNMQRDADDLEYEMSQIERSGDQPPRHMIDKHKQILRDIEELKAGETSN
jgi:hypothetical protein